MVQYFNQSIKLGDQLDTKSIILSSMQVIKQTSVKSTNQAIKQSIIQSID